MSATEESGNGDPGGPSYEEVVRGLMFKQAELRGDPEELVEPLLPPLRIRKAEGPSEVEVPADEEARIEPDLDATFERDGGAEDEPEPERWARLEAVEEPDEGEIPAAEADEELEPQPEADVEPGPELGGPEDDRSAAARADEVLEPDSDDEGEPDSDDEPEEMIGSEADPSEGFEIRPAWILEPELEPAGHEPYRAWWRDNEPWWISLGEGGSTDAGPASPAPTGGGVAEPTPDDVPEWAGVWTPAAVGPAAPAGGDQVPEAAASRITEDRALFSVGIGQDEPHPDPLGSELWATRPDAVTPDDGDGGAGGGPEATARVDLSGGSPTLDLTGSEASPARDPEAAARISQLEERLAEALGEMRRLTETIDTLAETLQRRAEHPDP